MKKIILSATIICCICMSFLTFENDIKWHTNYEKAIKEASTKNQPILLFFHGSDWCPPCIQMQKEVFSNKDFIAFASNKVIFLDVDFPYQNPLSPQQLKHNMAVKLKFGLPKEFKEGFPQVIIIDATGKVLYQEKGYDGKGAGNLTSKINAIIASISK